MDIACPFGPHRDGVEALTSFKNDAPDEQARFFGMPPAPKPPEKMKFGCTAIFQLFLWISLAYGLFGRLAENQSWGLLVMFAGVLVLALAAQIVLYRRRRAQENAGLELYAKDQKEWEAAMAIWNRLCYCPQHRIVFDPQDPAAWREPEATRELLYPAKEMP